MTFYDLIIKKRDGGELKAQEISYMVKGFNENEIPDYQMAAMAMAIYFQGMTDAETTALTHALAYSGEVLDLTGITGVKVDKHSTGGVGDKVTLVLLPLLVAMGYKVAKMSGRGLGHSGGTIDKLEGISGFQTELTINEFIKQVGDIGLAIVGQTKNLTPADKRLYSLRDVTGTVDSIPLIAASVMSKKIAGGADRIVLDVKVGRGAFVKDLNDARRLAEIMVRIGIDLKRETIAVITGMEQPLGRSVGNNLEVIEAIETLQGQGPADLIEVVTTLAGAVYRCDHPRLSLEEGAAFASKVLAGAEPYRNFCRFVKAQGGDLGELNLAQSFTVTAPRPGNIVNLDALLIGRAAVALGAGRARKEDPIDHKVGVYLHKKMGDSAEKGEPIATLYANSKQGQGEACRMVRKAFTINDKITGTPPLIIDHVAFQSSA